MKRTLVFYEHTRVGFPRVKLKWWEDNGRWTKGYITVAGVMSCEWTWSQPNPEPHADHEMKIFDDFVLRVFGHRADLQG
jgi:hypothetical protein